MITALNLGSYKEKKVPAHTPPRLSEEQLAAATARFAVPCTDIVLIDEHGHMILAYRRNAAARGWWWFGGALSAGVTPRQNVNKILRREIGFVPRPVHFLGIAHHTWGDCRERPGERRDDLLLIHYAMVNEKTIQHITLDPGEYDAGRGLMRFNGKQRVRPVVRDVFASLRL